MKIVKAVLKIGLVVLALLLLFVASVLASEKMQWPLWTSGLLFLGALALLLVLQGIVRWFVRRRQRGFLVTRDASGGGRMGSIQTRWREGLNVLSRSRLGVGKDSRYALPWLMTMGAPGSGKTALLARSRLASPLADADGLCGEEATDTFDLRFFDRAMIIDTCGRWSMAANGDADHTEWRRLLTLIAAARRREPVNGVLVALGVDELRGTGAEELRERGKRLRVRLDELMRVMGSNVPVTLAVTKIDQLYGVPELWRRLDEESRRQAMGYQIPAAGPVEKVVGAAFDSVVGTFNDLALAALYAGGAFRDNDAARRLRRAALLAPQEVASLRDPLAAFARGAFAENPYQETPYLRGIYFLAALDGADARSALLDQLGFGPAPLGGGPVPGAGGLFVGDLLSRIMPDDRGRETELLHTRTRRRATALAGLGLWMAAVGGAALWLALAFTDTFNDLKGIVDAYPASRVAAADLGADLDGMVAYKKLILGLDDVVSRLNLLERPFAPAVNRMRSAMKADFVTAFSAKVADPIDQALVMRLGGKEGITGDLQGEVVEQVTSRINLIGARLAGGGYDQLKTMLLPSAGALALLNTKIDEQDLEEAPHLYVAAIAWETDEAKLAAQQNRLREWLEDLALSEKANFQWMADWVDNSTDLPAVTMDQFWKGSRSLFGLPSVSPGYTKQGIAAINDYLGKIETATQRSLKFDRKKGEFEEWYRQQRLAAWRRFVAGFMSGAALLYGQDEWKRTAQGAMLPDGPFFSLAARLKDEFAGDATRSDTPPWLSMALGFDAIKALGANQSNAVQEASLFTKLIATDLTKAFSSPKNALSLAKGGEVTDQLAAAKAFKEYVDKLAKATADGATGSAKGFKGVSDLFAVYTDPGAPPSDLADAFAAYGTVKTKMTGDRETGEPFFTLVRGPWDFVVDYLGEEAGCYLQGEWNRTVVNMVADLTAGEMREKLFGDAGVVWGFVQGPAKPFLWGDASGYYPFEASGHRIRFNDTFFRFLNQGLVQKAGLLSEKPSAQDPLVAAYDQKKAAVEGTSYTVSLEGMPTDVKPAADADPAAIGRPFGVTLSVACADGAKSFDNFNFPAKGAIVWSGKNCGDTTLSVRFKEFDAVKTWPGTKGFVGFVRAFSDGAESFALSDFPDARARMAKLGLEGVTVRYKIDGYATLLADYASLDEMAAQIEEQKTFNDARRQAELAQLAAMWQKAAIPAQVVACWDTPLVPLPGEANRPELVEVPLLPPPPRRRKSSLLPPWSTPPRRRSRSRRPPCNPGPAITSGSGPTGKAPASTPIWPPSGSPGKGSPSGPRRLTAPPSTGSRPTATTRKSTPSTTPPPMPPL